MKNDVLRRVAGPAVAAFDAQMEAEEAGVLYTSDQWSFAKSRLPVKLPSLPAKVGRGSDPLGLPILPTPHPPQPSFASRVRGSIPVIDTRESVTQRIPVEILATLTKQCQMSSDKPLAHTVPARRK